jgi:alkylated DNA repair dioxygenase AlkB
MSKRARSGGAGGGGSAAAAGGATTALANTNNTIPLRVGWQRLPPGNVLVGYFPSQLSEAEADEARRVLFPADSGAHAPLDAVGWQQRSVRLFGREVPQPRLVSYWADSPDLGYTYSGLTLRPRCWREQAGGEEEEEDEEEEEEEEGGAQAQAAVARTLRALRAAVERACRRRLEPGAEVVGDGDVLPPNTSSSSSFFNSCLLNLYRDGRDAVGWHADDEPLFGPSPVVASLSLGARRDFFLRRRRRPAAAATSAAGPPRPRYWCPLGGDGDVLVMAGEAQSEYLHAVPARAASRVGGGGGGGGGAAAAATTTTAATASAARVSLTFRRVVVGGEQCHARE